MLEAIHRRLAALWARGECLDDTTTCTGPKLGLANHQVLAGLG